MDRSFPALPKPPTCSSVGRRPIPDPAVTEWRARSAAEYRSAAIAAQAAHLVISIGLDPSLARTALSVVQDELDHADLAADVAVALGGSLDPMPLQLDVLSVPPAEDGPLGTLVDLLIPDLLIGETLAVPLFRRMREGTTHAAARRALDRILSDEARHRRFGWDLLDALLALDPEGVRARALPVLLYSLSCFRQSHDGTGPPFQPDHRRLGLIAPSEYREIFEELLVGDLHHRLAARGLDDGLVRT